MYAAPRRPVIDHPVQPSRAGLESGYAPGAPGDLAARRQEVAQRPSNVVTCDCLNRVLLTRPTERSMGYA